MVSVLFVFFFFFQAEDGIRDRDVTGVQTCALPISAVSRRLLSAEKQSVEFMLLFGLKPVSSSNRPLPVWASKISTTEDIELAASKIGRASCRERVEIVEVGGGVRKKREGKVWSRR